MKHLNQSTRIKLTVTKEVYSEITYLCKRINSVEWSGLLFYDLEGSIKDPENLRIVTRAILPLDKGNATYTEYEVDERYVNFINKNEQFEDCLYGATHSHNNMESFFSGTDIKDLEINAPKNNIYLSLIVNNKEQMVAKFCFVANTNSSQTTAKALDEFGQEYVINVDNENQQYLVIYDCDIEIERPYLREDFIQAVEDIMTVPVYNYGSNFNYGNNYSDNIYGINYNSNGTISSYSKSYGVTPSKGKSVPLTPSTSYSKKKDLKKDVEKDYFITSTIPEFSVNVLISFSDRATFKDFMDVLEYYIDYEISPKVLQETFFDNFEHIYSEYFPNIKSDEGFRSVLEALLEEYEDFLTIKPSKYNKYIEVLVEAIQKMINKI
jgi:hypothetical protein